MDYYIDMGDGLMRRRSVITYIGSSFVALAGCMSDGAEPTANGCGNGGEATGDPDQGHPNPRAAFRSAVQRNSDEYVQTMSLEGTHWMVEYAVEECCGEPFEVQQATLARNFSAVRPADVSLTVMTFHECTNIHWRIPAQLADEHRCGVIDTGAYVRRVQNTTTRENTC